MPVSGEEPTAVEKSLKNSKKNVVKIMNKFLQKI